MSDLPSEASASAWARMLAAHRRAIALIEKRLKRESLPRLVWYDALLEIERAGARGIRPVALERRMVLAQHNLSRLIDRLEAAGYVERRGCPEDGRGQTLHPTPAGRAMRRKMWPVYAAAIEEAIGAKLNDAQARQLASLLERL